VNLVPPPTCQSPIGVCLTATLDGGKFPETYDFVMDTLETNDEGTVGTFTGHSVITRVHGGATLIGQDTGVLTFVPGGMATFVTTVNIEGGTKQFARATGQYVMESQVSFATGEGSGAFTSTVCK
jgi:hypothetical protein